MKRAEYPPPLRTLIAELKRLPGIGTRSAERIALWMLQSRDAHPGTLAEAIHAATERIHPCSQCGFFTETDPCALCSDAQRDGSVLCIVEQPTDILPMERSGAFNGMYHVLGGRISPLEHVGPESLRIAQLLVRLRERTVQEVILALSADVEGEATAHYLAETLAPLNLRVSRLAQGLPAGVGLEFADELTLSRALTGRTRIAAPGVTP
jgi:recombination protein RecR